MRLINPIIPGEYRYPTITPFTIPDGHTYLKTLERLVECMKHLVDSVNENNEEMQVFVVELINTKIGEINDAFEQQQQDVTDQLAQQNANVTTQLNDQNDAINTLISETETLVNDAINTVINNSIELQDTVLSGIIGDTQSDSRKDLDQLYRNDGEPAYFVKGGVNEKVESLAVDYGVVRTADSTVREKARNNTNGRYLNTEIYTHKIGNMVHISGFIQRNTTEGDVEPFTPNSTFVSPFTISEAMIPVETIKRPGNQRIVIPIVGWAPSASGDASKISAPGVLQISANGAATLFNASDKDVLYFTVNHTYIAEQSTWIDTLDYPEFSGTYFKSFMRNQNMVEGVNYSVINRRGTDTRLTSLAIHAGSGEYGSESCADILAETLNANLYRIDGFNGDYSNLHMSSNGFDDPRAIGFVRNSERTVSWHGFRDEPEWSPPGTSYIGGLDSELKDALINALNIAGFTAIDATQFNEIAGTNPANICNQGANGGVQIELDNTLRRSFFEGGDFGRINRPNKTQTFYDYMNVVTFTVNQVLNT